MRVGQIMTAGADVVTVNADASIARAVEKMMDHGIGALPVVDHDRVPVGLVAERDIARAVHEQGGRATELSVQRIMRRPPPLCTVDDDLRDVMSRMTRERLRHLIARDEEGRIAGVISVGDLLKHRLRELETETGVLRDYVAGQRGRF